MCSRAKGVPGIPSVSRDRPELGCWQPRQRDQAGKKHRGGTHRVVATVGEGPRDLTSLLHGQN